MKTKNEPSQVLFSDEKESKPSLVICAECKAEFDLSQARKETDRRWGMGRYDFVQKYRGYLCERCVEGCFICIDLSGSTIDPTQTAENA